MSSAEVAVQVFRSLQSDDLKVLQVIETGMKKHEYVPIDQIALYSKILVEKIDFELDRLDRLNLIYRMRAAFVGYTLNYAGYDCLAINALVKAEVLEAFGKSLGVGKEADVFDALDPKGTRVAIKFHRLGRTSFRQTRRKRAYIPEHASWLFQSRLAAEKEFEALKLTHACGVAVPEPIFQNRHTIVMGVIEGGELSQYREIEDPLEVLEEILLNVRKAYLDAGVVHADLSEYNVILKPDRHVLIIDWPQYVTKDHPNSKDLLTRDVKNLLDFFNRRFRVKVEIEEVYNFVTGKAKSLAF
jgi:RIO kinase 2